MDRSILEDSVGKPNALSLKVSMAVRPIRILCESMFLCTQTVYYVWH